MRTALLKSNIEGHNIEKNIYLEEVDNLPRLKRAKIEKRAKPPLRPAPIENPFTEAKMILRSFSESLNGSELNSKEEGEDEQFEDDKKEGSDLLHCMQVQSTGLPILLSLNPSFSQERREQQSPSLEVPSQDGDIVAAATCVA